MWKITILRQKIIFVPIWGGGGGGGVPGAPPLDLPLYKVQLLIKGPFLGSIECPIYTGLTVRVSIKEVVNTVMIVMVC